jgi:hypothetical protein
MISDRMVQSGFYGVCCVHDDISLTYGKSYFIIHNIQLNGFVRYMLTNDLGDQSYYIGECFITKEEFRNRKLNSILS